MLCPDVSLPLHPHHPLRHRLWYSRLLQVRQVLYSTLPPVTAQYCCIDKFFYAYQDPDSNLFKIPIKILRVGVGGGGIISSTSKVHMRQKQVKKQILNFEF